MSEAIESITIIGGVGRDGQIEPVGEIKLNMGDIISIVGMTGSGKTRLINDIEVFCNKNTPSMRTILVNDSLPSEEFLDGPAKNPVALITQHTNFLADMPVARFLQIHAKIRLRDDDKSSVPNHVNEVIEFANQLTGEHIQLDCSMTELSGGQTRALMIADAVIIGNAPILLLDELESGGIHRRRAIELMKNYNKIFCFVTHDVRIAMGSNRRIVMKGGAMVKVIEPDEEEQSVAEEVRVIDDRMYELRNALRQGELLRKGKNNDEISKGLM